MPASLVTAAAPMHPFHRYEGHNHHDAYAFAASPMNPRPVIGHADNAMMTMPLADMQHKDYHSAADYPTPYQMSTPLPPPMVPTESPDAQDSFPMPTCVASSMMCSAGSFTASLTTMADSNYAPSTLPMFSWATTAHPVRQGVNQSALSVGMPMPELRADIHGNFITLEDELNDARMLQEAFQELPQPAMSPNAALAMSAAVTPRATPGVSEPMLPLRAPSMMLASERVRLTALRDGSKRKVSSRVCRVPGCTKGIRSRGLCKAHGGGRRCQTAGCTISDQGGGHCIAHGGGRRCSVQDCTKSAQSKGLCKLHGGARRCRVPDCMKNGQIRGLCRLHFSQLSAEEKTTM